jgi:hypothetical protein
MNYSLDQGVESMVALMTEYETRFGERFKPSVGWSLLDAKEPV